MSRGRGGSEVEQERVKRDEIGNTRPAGKRGAGPANFEHKGFGSEKGMQTNPKGGMPADKHGI
jgi:hypothetical protein